MQYMLLCICYMTVYISMLSQCSSALVQFGVKLHVIYHNELHYYIIPYHITTYVIKYVSAQYSLSISRLYITYYSI